MRKMSLIYLLTENKVNSKEELINAAKEYFKRFEDVNSEDFNFSLEAAIYYLANHNHEGQNSTLYSILSTSPYNPGRLENFDSWLQNDIMGREIYDYLANKFGYEDTNEEGRQAYDDWEAKQESNLDSNLSKKDPSSNRWDNPEDVAPQYEDIKAPENEYDKYYKEVTGDDIQVFNTNRKYTSHGQRIAFKQLEDGRIAFYDVDRQVGGITNELYTDGMNDIKDKYEGAKEFLIYAYDKNAYENLDDSNLINTFKQKAKAMTEELFIRTLVREEIINILKNR